MSPETQFFGVNDLVDGIKLLHVDNGLYHMVFNS